MFLLNRKGWDTPADGQLGKRAKKGEIRTGEQIEGSIHVVILYIQYSTEQNGVGVGGESEPLFKKKSQLNCDLQNELWLSSSAA